VSTEPQSTPAPSAQPQPQPGPQPGPQVADHVIKHTRISGLWVAVAFFAVVLLLLLIFILQNGRTVDVAYFGAHGHVPLGVALLLAAVCGALLAVLAGVARMAQLRATARRHRRADARRTPATSVPADPRG
jgi:lipopolysaccharide assembly protein A